MNQDRPYWNMKMEPLLNTPEMGKIQLEKLKIMLGRMKANAPFYTRMFEKAGIDP
jgi:phenylacetate-coenzyme A ligase PaaK-like adenylate-forming protein